MMIATGMTAKGVLGTAWQGIAGPDTQAACSIRAGIGLTCGAVRRSWAARRASSSAMPNGLTR